MKDFTDSLLSYAVAALAYISTLHLVDVYNVMMPVGSVLLLLARLYVDVPKALARWRSHKGVANGSERR